jgi:hypothetical protein
MADDGGVFCVTPLSKASSTQLSRPCLGQSMDNPRWLDLGLLERTMAALSAILLLGGIILELLLVVEVRT